MPNPLPRVSTQAAFVDAVSIQDVFGGRGGSYVVENQPVKYQLQYGKLGETFWTEEADLLPGPGSIEAGAIGVRFKSSGAQSAIVSGRIAPPTQPILTPTGAGAIGAALITGIVAGNGTITAGSGFTVNRTAVGQYTVTFTTAFAAVPLVLGNLIQAIVQQENTLNIFNVLTTGFQAQTALDNSGTGAGRNFVDAPWNFAAQAVL